jgi:hypothetical protein
MKSKRVENRRQFQEEITFLTNVCWFSRWAFDWVVCGFSIFRCFVGLFLFVTYSGISFYPKMIRWTCEKEKFQLIREKNDGSFDEASRWDLKGMFVENKAKKIKVN